VELDPKFEGGRKGLPRRISFFRRRKLERGSTGGREQRVVTLTPGHGVDLRNERKRGEKKRFFSRSKIGKNGGESGKPLGTGKKRERWGPARQSEVACRKKDRRTSPK